MKYNLQASPGHGRVDSVLMLDDVLQSKIDREMKMLDGASKLLSVANNEQQMIFSLKSMMISYQRLLNYVKAIQRKQESMIVDITPRSSLTPCSGKIILSDLRFFLDWAPIAKNKECKRYVSFVLAKVEGNVLESGTIIIDRGIKEIRFPNVFIFEQIRPDFKLEIEFYALNISKGLTAEVCKTAANFYSDMATVLLNDKKERKLPGLTNSKDSDMPLVNFKQSAKTRLMLKDVGSAVQTRTLIINSDDYLLYPPLRPNMLLQFIAIPLCVSKCVYAGYLLNAYRRPIHCSLQDGKMTITSLHQGLENITVVPVNEATQVCSRCDEDDRVYNFTIFNRESPTVELHATCRTVMDIWITAIQQHILDLKSWEPSCKDPMVLPKISADTVRISQKRMLVRSRSEETLDSEPIVCVTKNYYLLDYY